MIERNLILLNEKIRQACKTYNRNFDKIRLIAVSKTFGSEEILQAIDCGCQVFGENYLKEAAEKWPKIKEKFPEIKLHFIGHLQSNKTAEAVALFDCIQTVDSKKLASFIKKESDKQNKNPEIFIQVNIGEEAQKSGVLPSETDDLIDYCRNDLGLNLTGLMCIPPSDELASPYFALLAKIAARNNIQNLSMGMSSDFSEAIAMGATHIRLGTAIFGSRLLVDQK
jgi:pyridoxal phosphate enzyme (YggS family)